MKLFVLISAVLVVARAGVIDLPLVVPLGQHSSQYHSQDAIGQYAYGYADQLSAKNEVRSADGQTVGSYSYVDPKGQIQNVQYRSDALHGFRVAATNLPVAPSPVEVPALSLPEPVKDTPEVVEARSKHLEAVRHAEEDAKKLTEAVSVEVKSAIPAHPAVISAATPSAVVSAAPAAVEVVRASPIVAAPFVAAPSFGYSFGVNHAGLYTVNAYSVGAQPIVTAYAAPGHLIAAPIVATATHVSGHVQAVLPEVPKDLPEVVEARAKHLEAVESIKKDIEKEQQHQAKE